MGTWVSQNRCDNDVVSHWDGVLGSMCHLRVILTSCSHCVFSFHVGIITYEGSGMLEKLALGPLGVSVEVAMDEGAMMNTVIDRVRQMDPDILAGYEVHNLSWGYLVDRYQAAFSMDMTKLISRIRSLRPPLLSKSAMEAQNSFNSRKNSGLKIVGRHVFNVWRLIRGEVALTNYGYCNVVFHVLQQR